MSVSKTAAPPRRPASRSASQVDAGEEAPGRLGSSFLGASLYGNSGCCAVFTARNSGHRGRGVNAAI